MGGRLFRARPMGFSVCSVSFALFLLPLLAVFPYLVRVNLSALEGERQSALRSSFSPPAIIFPHSPVFLPATSDACPCLVAPVRMGLCFERRTRVCVRMYLWGPSTSVYVSTCMSIRVYMAIVVQWRCIGGQGCKVGESEEGADAWQDVVIRFGGRASTR